MIDPEKPRKKITITIDGRPYATRDDDQEAAALLRLAGLDPAKFDLAKVLAPGKTRRYKDEKVIDLRDGDAFVTIREMAPVA